MSKEYSDFVRGRFKTFGPRDIDASVENPAQHPNHGAAISPLALTLHHATTGMVGELIELRQAVSAENLKEELGDFEFYFEAFLQNLPFELKFEQFGSPMPYAAYDSISRWLNASGELLDLTKKLWIYNKPLDAGMREKIERQISIINTTRASMYANCGFDYHEVIKYNVDKLTKRYPVGYSDQAAQTRADKEAGQ